MNESTISKYGLENIQLPDIWKSKHQNKLRSPIQMSRTQESIPSNQLLDLESVISLSHPFHCYPSLILGVDWKQLLLVPENSVMWNSHTPKQKKKRKRSQFLSAMSLCPLCSTFFSNSPFAADVHGKCLLPTHTAHLPSFPSSCFSALLSKKYLLLGFVPMPATIDFEALHLLAMFSH